MECRQYLRAFLMQSHYISLKENKQAKQQQTNKQTNKKKKLVTAFAICYVSCSLLHHKEYSEEDLPY